MGGSRIRFMSVGYGRLYAAPFVGIIDGRAIKLVHYYF